MIYPAMIKSAIYHSLCNLARLLGGSWHKWPGPTVLPTRARRRMPQDMSHRKHHHDAADSTCDRRHAVCTGPAPSLAALPTAWIGPSPPLAWQLGRLRWRLPSRPDRATLAPGSAVYGRPATASSIAGDLATGGRPAPTTWRPTAGRRQPTAYFRQLL